MKQIYLKMAGSVAYEYVGTYHDPFLQLDILESGSREDIINWLVWNDSNGCYTDEDNELESFDPLTLEQAREIMAGQINQ